MADALAVERFVESVRSYGRAVVLAPQVVEGMGGPDVAARVMGSVGTVLLHQVPNPEEIIRLAGTRLEIESSLQHEAGWGTGAGSARAQHTFEVSPNEVRRLGPGTCFAIGSGRAQKLLVARAPEKLPDVPLPVPVPPLRARADRPGPPAPARPPLQP